MTEKIATKEALLAAMAQMLDRAVTGDDGAPAFRILRVVLAYGRNRGMAEVEIGGAVHEVRIRNSTGNVHLPAALKEQPYQMRERIKAAAGVAVSLAEREHLPVGAPIEPPMWQRLISSAP